MEKEWEEWEVRPDAPFYPNHIGHAVRDVEKTSKFLSAVLGIERWWKYGFSEEVEEDVMVGDLIKGKVAWTRLGSDMEGITLELLQPLDENSPYRQHLETVGEGPHHVGFYISGWGEKVSKILEKGAKIVYLALNPGDRKRWGYFKLRPGGIIFDYEEREEGLPLFFEGRAGFDYDV